MKKRFLSAFLALALIVSLCPMAFAASGQIKASLSSAQVKQGEKVSIQFKLDENPGFVSTNIQVNWPKDDLTLMAVSGTDTITGWMGEPIPSDGKTDGKYVLAWQNNTIPSNILTTGVLCTLEFATLSSGSVGEKEITLSTDGPGQGFANFDMDTVDAVLTGGKITISSAITGSLLVDIAKPVVNQAPVTTLTDTRYSGTITWTPDVTGGKFAASTEYTANVTLTAKDGYQFASDVNPTVTDATISDKNVSPDGKTLTFKAAFDKTGAATLTGIKIIDKIDGQPLTVAVPHAAPNTTETNTLTLAAASVYDDGTGGPVAATWEITNDPKLTGVSIDEATGKLTVTNKAAGGEVEVKAAYNGMTDTKTVTITKETLKLSAIVATAPATGTDIIIPNGGTNTSGNCSYKVYDQYGAEMTGTTATWKMDPETVTGVTFIPANGSISVNNTATTSTVKLYAESGGVKSNEITFNITREESKPKLVTITGADSMNVPIVHAPGADGWEHKTYTAEVKDQYNNVISNPSVEWSVTGATGVSIDATTGKLTVSNKANAGPVTITAKSGDASGTKTVTINKEPEKATLVEICNQVGKAPETRLLIPAATFTNSEAYTAKVYDQYGVYMPGEMVHWALDPATVAGVKLDTTTSTGNAILKVDSTATSGTTFKLKATTSTLGTTGVKKLDITLVNKTPASVATAPTAKTGLKYNGSEQVLLDTPGTADGGTMQYSLDNGATWRPDVPTGKNAGDYNVQYKVAGNSTHTDSTTGTLTVTIGPKVLQSSDLEKSGGSATKVYNGNATSSITVGVKAGVLYGSDTLSITGTAVYNSANVNEANTITFTPNAITTGNYQLAATEKLTINNASITPRDLTVTPNANQSKKFGAADPTLHSTNSGRVTGQIPDFSGALSRAEGEDVGQYDITLGTLALIDHFSSGFKASNYTLKMVSPAVKFEITKADAPTAPTGLKGYKDSTLSTVTLPTGWSWVNGTLKMDTIGDQTFQANYAGDTNHQAKTNVDVTVKVVQRSSGGYYYTPTTAVVPDMPMLYRGCTGDAVKTLQDKLNALGYNSGNVDGIFGAKTYAAVTAFQKANSLGVDGIVGKLTWGKLYGVSPAMPVETTTVVGRPMVSYGSRGDAVRKLQELLNALGYDCGSVDGIFGSKTKAAVLAFQKANGLGVDGIVGPLTWAKLG